MTQQAYNGWTNYETWAAHMWLTNDEGNYAHMLEMCNEIEPKLYDETGDEPYERVSIYAAADRIKEYLDELSYEAMPDATIFRDLLTAALSNINYEEIARAFQEEQ